MCLLYSLEVDFGLKVRTCGYGKRAQNGRGMVSMHSTLSAWMILLEDLDNIFYYWLSQF